MAHYQVDVDTTAYQAGIPAAIEELKGLSEAFLVEVADKVVILAKGFAPKRTGALAESIHADPPERTGLGIEITVSAGSPGIRETVFMEFGTYKDRPHPYMRPALAAAARGLRGLGYAARLSYSNRAALFARRSRARVRVQQQQRKGLQLTPAEARVVGRTISSRLRYRGPKVTYRRPRKPRGG